MYRQLCTILAAGLLAGPLAVGQTRAEKKTPAAAAEAVRPAGDAFADELAKRLGDSLNVKTVVGDPIKVGSVTVIPILTVEVNFGGGGVAVPESAPAPAKTAAAKPDAKSEDTPKTDKAGGLFYMSGDAHPLGFVVIGAHGARFISLPGTPAK